LQDNAAAIAAVAAVRAAAGHKFFAVKTHAAITAASAFHRNFNSVNKHIKTSLITVLINKKPATLTIQSTGLLILFWKSAKLRFDRNNAHGAGGLAEFHFAVAKSKEREIAAAADVFARMELGAALTDDDVAGENEFAAILFNTQILRIAVATVTAAGLTFLMCHDKIPLCKNCKFFPK